MVRRYLCPSLPPASLSARILAEDSRREIQFLLTALCCPDRIYHPQPGARQTCTHSQLHLLQHGLMHTRFIEEQKVISHTHTRACSTQFRLIMQRCGEILCTFTSGIIVSCRFSWLLRIFAAPVDDTDADLIDKMTRTPMDESAPLTLASPVPLAPSQISPAHRPGNRETCLTSQRQSDTTAALSRNGQMFVVLGRTCVYGVVHLEATLGMGGLPSSPGLSCGTSPPYLLPASSPASVRRSPPLALPAQTPCISTEKHNKNTHQKYAFYYPNVLSKPLTVTVVRSSLISKKLDGEVTPGPFLNTLKRLSLLLHKQCTWTVLKYISSSSEVIKLIPWKWSRWCPANRNRIHFQALGATS